MATMKGRITLYREGTQIWEKSVESPLLKKTAAYETGFTSEEEMGEVAFQALNYTLKKLAEEMAQDPDFERNVAGATTDGRKKAYARQ